MNTARVQTLKAILWAVFGVGAVAIVARLINGLGVATNLSNMVSWGVWNAIKISLVPLSAGGFVLAGAVYIFGLERFRPVLRLGILTGFLGYATFATLLMFDIGVPWRIWHPVVFWNHHSVLFEVAWCVMLYLSVLALEFGPVALEHRLFDRPLFHTLYKFLKAVTVPLVIAGIVLSTLHQSSLGSLFLIVPQRLDPLWYSPIIYLLFLLSAIGMGLLVVVAQAVAIEWFYGARARVEILSPLAYAGAIAMLVYFGVRAADLLIRGVLPGSLSAAMGPMFIVEAVLSVVVPLFLLSPAVRRSGAGLFVCSLSAVIGIALHRTNVSLLAIDWGGAPYWPAWTEYALAAGLLAGAVLVFLFLIENLDVYGDLSKREDKPTAGRYASLLGAGVGQAARFSIIEAPRRYSLVAVAAAALAVALLPREALFGAEPRRTPVKPPERMTFFFTERAEGAGHDMTPARLGEPARAGARLAEILVIDGDRANKNAPLYHDNHIAQLGGEDASCAKCHHMNMPGDENTECWECHRDMFLSTDIFDHAFHVDELGGNEGCVKCHADRTAPKTRATATACAECHAEDMLVSNAAIRPPEGGLQGYAPGYYQAMHELCIPCHEQRAAETPEKVGEHFGRCDTCHRDLRMTQLRNLPPFSGGARGAGTD